jgi:hypothetical protein
MQRFHAVRIDNGWPKVNPDDSLRDSHLGRLPPVITTTLNLMQQAR